MVIDQPMTRMASEVPSQTGKLGSGSTDQCWDQFSAASLILIYTAGEYVAEVVWLRLRRTQWHLVNPHVKGSTHEVGSHCISYWGLAKILGR